MDFFIVLVALVLVSPMFLSSRRKQILVSFMWLMGLDTENKKISSRSPISGIAVMYLSPDTEL